MAEAVVEAVTNPYFCHKCSQEISPVLPDYVCPRCRSGFIEELTNTQRNNTNDDLDEHSNDDDNYHDAEGFENFIANFDFRNSQRYNNSSSANGENSSSAESSNEHNTRSNTTPFVEYRVHVDPISDLFSNMRRSAMIDFPLNIDFPLFQVLHGNPGDYAWGSGGLDAVITHLLNQMDGTGPPPMPATEINELPVVKITQDDIDKNLQCTVCMEDYRLDEAVKQLSCSHVYHKDCIVPWLEMHATCPICRKSLSQSTSASGARPSGSSGFLGQMDQMNTTDATNRTGFQRRRRFPRTSHNTDGYCELPDDYD